LRGHFETGRTPWQTVTGNAESCSGAADCEGDGVVYSINHQGGNVEQIIADKTGTLTAAMNSSGNNKLSVAYALDQQGGKGGANYAENVMPTLCSDSHGTPHAVAYSFDSLASNSMKSSNPHSGCREVNIAKCLDTTDPNPCKNQGGIAVVEQIPYTLKIRSGCEGGGKGALVQEDKSATLATNNDQFCPNPYYCLQGAGATSQNSQGMGHKTNTSYTLNTTDVHGVCYTLSHGGFMVNPGDDGVADTLQATDYKDPQVITYGVDARNATEYPELTGALQADAAHNLNSNNVVRIQYIVRRLTPTECARLQGFPDTWGHPDEKTDLTYEEYQFWLNVRNTHAAINDKATKEYTKDQILKWYNSLHTDSSEYKMWGNGIALPNALYMMQGIADVMTEEKAARRKWLNDLLGGCL
jgi:DNA (cytosine-5)-methyltransferase 1